MLKLFKLQGLDAAGQTVQTLAYRYGHAEAHLAPDIRRIRSSQGRNMLTAMRARGLTVLATREPL